MTNILQRERASKKHEDKTFSRLDGRNRRRAYARRYSSSREIYDVKYILSQVLVASTNVNTFRLLVYDVKDTRTSS